MRAIVAARFGPPDVLELQDIPDPVPGRGQVLILTHAIGVNPVDTSNRQDGAWAGITAPAVVGSDVAGVVAAVGPGVDQVRTGDRVYAMVDFLGRQVGTYAELVVADADLVFAMPQDLTFVEAAAVPLAAGTAYEAVVNRLRVRAGETIAILGAAGGVGAFATQLAVMKRARVIAIASRHHWALLESLGAARCIDHHDGPLLGRLRAESPEGVDALLDLVGQSSLANLVEAVRPFGRVASTVALDGNLDPAIDRNLTIHGILVRPDGERLRRLTKLIRDGKIRPIVDEVLPWERASDAHVRIETGHGRGKVVLEVVRP